MMRNTRTMWIKRKQTMRTMRKLKKKDKQDKEDNGDNEDNEASESTGWPSLGRPNTGIRALGGGRAPRRHPPTPTDTHRHPPNPPTPTNTRRASPPLSPPGTSARAPTHALARRHRRGRCRRIGSCFQSRQLTSSRPRSLKYTFKVVYTPLQVRYHRLKCRSLG